ncbi:interferon-inducible double-stranded RNA-dependent protein kinase activator A homolog A isoform X2 [Tetranychus urticae]|uniref:interferon-inducible double-stranded RNA-dependent protein kinase activator A homolog A isoform X2 n=1 Tax=Tetranychus urticae TaxID=32264 RepID=UPI00077BC8D8|nr:interferon-inducible double-stranded RNA-dependent protein kinase activator A homolog A isoform X2 [Tetranychus urticae]
METPINVLQNICARHNWTIEYNMISEEGRPHGPTFTYRVFIEETQLSAIAAGSSKKKAKQAAAFQAIKIIAEQDEEAAKELPALEEIVPREPEAVPVETKDNPIGKLQEICMKNKWTPPKYIDDEEDGPAHAKIFVITCKLENLDIQSEGRDKTKKGGKKIAAQEMLKLLALKGLCDAQDDSFKSDSVPIKTDISEVDKIPKFFKKVNESMHRKLDDVIAIIDDEAETNDYIASLDEACAKMGLNTKFLDINKDKDGSYHVTVFLKKIGDSAKDVPVLTGWGTNKDLSLAKQKAAANALKLLDKVRYI